MTDIVSADSTPFLDRDTIFSRLCELRCEPVRRGPFTIGETARYVEASLGAPPSEDLLHWLHTGTGGVAEALETLIRAVATTVGFIRKGEVVELGARTCAVLPTDPVDAVHRHLDTLSDDASAVLALVACGDTTDERLLACAAGLEMDRVLECVDELVAARVLQREGMSGERSHSMPAAVGDVVARRLGSSACARLHAALADAGEALGRAPAWVATHLIAADPVPSLERILSAHRLLARQAARAGDTAAAAIHVEAALERLSVDDASGQRVEVLYVLGMLQRRLGRSEEALRTWREALALLPGDDMDRRAADLGHRLAILEWETGDVPLALHDLERARARVDTARSEIGLVESLECELLARMRLEDLTAIDRITRRLEKLTCMADAPGLVARYHLAAGIAHFTRTDYVAAQDHLERARVVGLETDDPLLEQRILNVAAVAATSDGDLDAMSAGAQAALDHAASIGAPVLGCQALNRLAGAALLGGRWAQAEELATRCRDLADQAGNRRGLVYAATLSAWLSAWRGDLDDARARLNRVAPMVSGTLRRDVVIADQFGLATMIVARESGDAGGEVVARTRFGVSSFGLLPLFSRVMAGSAQVRVGNLAQARTIAHRLRHPTSATSAYGTELADRLDGEIAEAGGDRASAAACYRRARRGLAARGFVIDAARLDLASSRVTDDPIRTRRLATRAAGVFADLGARRWSAAANRRLEALRGPDIADSEAEAAVRELSPRQLEVARLVAQGCSNREVADALYIGVRTVTTHLDNIYRKLGISSRAALTRRLADAGRLGPEDSTPLVVG